MKPEELDRLQKFKANLPPLLFLSDFLPPGPARGYEQALHPPCQLCVGIPDLGLLERAAGAGEVGEPAMGGGGLEVGEPWGRSHEAEQGHRYASLLPYKPGGGGVTFSMYLQAWYRRCGTEAVGQQATPCLQPV